MNRLFWGIALLVLVAGGGWSQSTWRGQAEIWSAKDAPADGFVAASNEFPRNSLLSIENYKTRKTVQVRVVAALPAGSSALVLLNKKAAQALEIKTGEIPLVGVRLDPTGVDRPDNPDPDVNPLAAKAPAPTAVAAAPSPSPKVAATPAAVPATPAPVAEVPARTPAVSSLDVARGTTALDPDLLPLPALAAPEPVAEPAAREPLPVSAEAEPETPVTPGRKVFVTTRDPEPVALEVPAVTEAPAAEAVAEPLEEPTAPLEPEPAPAVAETMEPAGPGAAPVVEPEAPAAAVAEAEPEPVSEPVAEAVPPPVPEPAPEPEPSVAAVPAVPAAAPAVLAVKPAGNTWVPVPGKLEGPVLGSVPLLAGLEKGRSYVQLGAWSSEAEVLTVLGTVKSYVPLALYRAEGEKNPWRVVVASAPKGQLGVLLMHYRSQGFRTAGMVKG